MSGQQARPENEHGGAVARLAAAAVQRGQAAYRAFVVHVVACAECRVADGRCPVAEELWTAYKGVF